MVQRLATAAAALAMLLAGAFGAQANVLITVDKSSQTLSVRVDGRMRYQWPVSTARWGYHTPNGTYRPERLERKWYSRKYDMSPMPYSIFFDGGYAIHGSYEVSRIGSPASHGCVRLHPRNAAVLFRLVAANEGATRIVVTGERRSRSAYYSSSRRSSAASRRSYAARNERAPRYYRAGRYQQEGFAGSFYDERPTGSIDRDPRARDDYYAPPWWDR
jgi:L,D-transpeptidase catalytic domain